MELSTLSELASQAGAFPFRVQTKSGLKLTIVSKREFSGNFDSKGSAKAKGTKFSGWRHDLRIWKLI